jgi:hypothetical protein
MSTITTEAELDRQADEAVRGTRHRVGIYGWSPGSGGVHFHRMAEPLRVAAQYGVHAFTGVELQDQFLSEVDHVLAHTIHGERETNAWHQLAALDSHKLIIDIDDWMWQPDTKTFQGHYTPEVLDRLYSNIRRAHVVTTPSPLIAEHLTRYNRNVWLLPNTVPAWLLDWQMPAREHPTIGYQGSPSHLRDFTSSTEIAIGRFLVDHPDWRLRVYGQTDVQAVRITEGGTLGRVGTILDDASRIEQIPWQRSIGAYYRSLSIDIGIGPLRDTAFNRAKSSLRAVEYAALGIVACLPDLPPYRGWVYEGVTGRLVHSGQSLRRVLSELAELDPAQRTVMSKQARALAGRWTTEANIEKWVEAWQS